MDDGLEFMAEGMRMYDVVGLWLMVLGFMLCIAVLKVHNRLCHVETDCIGIACTMRNKHYGLIMHVCDVILIGCWHCVTHMMRLAHVR